METNRDVLSYLNVSVERSFRDSLVFALDLNHIDLTAGNDDTIQIVFVGCTALPKRNVRRDRYGDRIGSLEYSFSTRRRRIAIDCG